MSMISDYGGSSTPADIRDLWQTPPEIFAALHREFRFVADVAASAQNQLLPVYFAGQDNALALTFPSIKDTMQLAGGGNGQVRDGLRPVFLVFKTKSSC